MEVAKYLWHREFWGAEIQTEMWPFPSQGVANEECWDSCGGAQAKLALVGFLGVVWGSFVWFFRAGRAAKCVIVLHPFPDFFRTISAAFSSSPQLQAVQATEIKSQDEHYAILKINLNLLNST